MNKIALRTQGVLAGVIVMCSGVVLAQVPSGSQRQDEQNQLQQLSEDQSGQLGGAPPTDIAQFSTAAFQGVDNLQQGGSSQPPADPLYGAGHLQGGGPLLGKSPVQGVGSLFGAGPLQGARPLFGVGPLQGASPLSGVGPLQGTAPLLTDGPVFAVGPVGSPLLTEGEPIILVSIAPQMLQPLSASLPDVAPFAVAPSATPGPSIPQQVSSPPQSDPNPPVDLGPAQTVIILQPGPPPPPNNIPPNQNGTPS